MSARPGATPSGSMPSDQGVREHKALSEGSNAAAEEGNFLEFVLHLPCTLMVHGYMCVLVTFKLWGPPLTWQTFVIVFGLQGGLRTVVKGQEGGKENVDLAPKGNPPRTPRSKKVIIPSSSIRVGVSVQIALGCLISIHIGLRESVVL